MQRPSVYMRLGIVLYQNTRRQLERLTRSLALNRASQCGPVFDVAFLDNSPTNALEALVRELAPEASYRLAPRNLGFGSGHNLLMEEAFGSPGLHAYVCVNPDAVLHPDCIHELLQEAERHATPGLVEALQFPDEHPKQYDAQTHLTPWCSGCVLLITRELYQSIGGFDENLFMYCEDVDLSWRARAAGFATCIAPRALAHHYVGDRPHDQRAHHRLLRSGIYLARKYGNLAMEQHWMNDYVTSEGEPFEAPTPSRTSAREQQVADFEHLFYMAEVRWC
jgi:N-acetylglucosaminyl-diphospho-decaprenol L-rhamnosyltransferase